MLNKILCALLALCLLLGCAALAETTYPLVEEPITVQGVAFQLNNGTTEDRLLWDKIAELTGVKVEWTFVPYEQREVFLAMGDWPDLFHGDFTSAIVEEYGAQAGMLVDFGKKLDIMPNLAKTCEDYPDARKQSYSSDGGIYRLPWINVSTTSASARWYFRYDKLEELGLEIPTTIDEYYDVLVALKAASGEAPMCDKLTPVHGYYNYAPGEGFFYAAFGTETNPNFADDGTGKVVYNRTGEQYRRYVQFLNKLYAEGLLHQEYLTMDNTTRQARIQSGATVFGENAWSSVNDASVFKNGFSDLRQLAPLTSQWDDTQAMPASPAASMSGPVVNANSEYADLICQVLDILYATEEVAEGTGLYGLAAIYGPENETWKYTNEEKTEWDWILPEGCEDTGLAYGLKSVIVSNSFGRVDGNFSTALQGPMSNGRARQLAFVENLIPYQEPTLFPANQMAFTEEEQNIITMYETEIRAHVDEWQAWFVAGVKDPNSDADWNEFVTAFDAMHLQDVIDAYQGAYDRYMAL